MPRPSHNLESSRFGKLLVGTTSRIISGRRWWATSCDCGTTIEVEAYKLLSGHTQSCGCLQRERTGDANRTHGRGSTAPGRIDPVHQVWNHMIQRCTNKKDPSYSNYGGRGIRVCALWAASFVDFLSDVGERPSTRHSLDRIDNDGNYEPGNIRWATPTEQANNRRSNRRITIGNATRTLSEWCSLRGVAQKLASQRLARGWSPETALTNTDSLSSLNEVF